MWTVMSISTRDLNTLKFEICYDASLNKENHMNKLLAIQEALKSECGYDFEYETGKKSANMHKLKWQIAFNFENDTKQYKDICYNIYKIVSKIWK